MLFKRGGGVKNEERRIRIYLEVHIPRSLLILSSAKSSVFFFISNSSLLQKLVQYTHDNIRAIVQDRSPGAMTHVMSEMSALRVGELMALPIDMTGWVSTEDEEEEQEGRGEGGGLEEQEKEKEEQEKGGGARGRG